MQKAEQKQKQKQELLAMLGHANERFAQIDIWRCLMRYRRKLTRAELSKQAFEKTKAMPLLLSVLDSYGKRWVLPCSLEALAKQNRCTERAALKMFHNVARMCKQGLLEPAKLGAIAA